MTEQEKKAELDNILDGIRKTAEGEGEVKKHQNSVDLKDIFSSSTPLGMAIRGTLGGVGIGGVVALLNRLRKGKKHKRTTSLTKDLAPLAMVGGGLGGLGAGAYGYFTNDHPVMKKIDDEQREKTRYETDNEKSIKAWEAWLNDKAITGGVGAGVGMGGAAAYSNLYRLGNPFRHFPGAALTDGDKALIAQIKGTLDNIRRGTPISYAGKLPKGSYYLNSAGEQVYNRVFGSNTSEILSEADPRWKKLWSLRNAKMPKNTANPGKAVLDILGSKNLNKANLDTLGKALRNARGSQLGKVTPARLGGAGILGAGIALGAKPALDLATNKSPGFAKFLNEATRVLNL